MEYLGFRDENGIQKMPSKISKGVGYCFEELRTQVYPIPEGNDDDIRSIYRDVDWHT